MMVIAALLLLGCTGERGNANETANVTANLTNATNMTAPYGYARFDAPSFSFAYPSNMETDSSLNPDIGSFTGTHPLADRPGEMLTVFYLNTSAAYGPNTDSGFQASPEVAAGSFLEGDRTLDPAGYLANATMVGPTSTFARGRDAFIAEAPFTVKNQAGTYAGYALSMYVPARSLEVQARILALNPVVASEMKDEFILTFRVE